VAEGPRWIDKSAYVMPALPESLGVDPVVSALLHVAAFLELSGDEAVDPDYAVEAMEHVGFYLSRLSAQQIAAIREQLDRVAAHAQAEGWREEAVEFFTELMGYFGLGGEGDIGVA
jgi:hypothetical protein